VNEALIGLMSKDIETIIAYADSNMKLNVAAAELGIGYKALDGRLNSIHKRSKLNPRKFRDLAKLLRIVEESWEE